MIFTLGIVTDVELELDDEELLFETLRTFIVATSSEKIPSIMFGHNQCPLIGTSLTADDHQ